MMENQNDNLNDLDRRFVDVVDHLDLPDNDLVSGVVRLIEADPVEMATEDRPNRRSATLLVAVGGLALVLVAILAVSNPVGPAVADWFGIGATAFEIDGESDPDAENEAGAGAEATDGAGTDDFVATPGAPVPDFAPIESLGRPDNVTDDPRRGRTYIWDDGAGNQIHLSARIADGSVLSVKSLAAADDVEFVTVKPDHGQPDDVLLSGVWIGAPHELRFPVEGLDLELTVDAGPVLIWVDGDVELRIEGASGPAEALEWAAKTVEGTRLVAAE